MVREYKCCCTAFLWCNLIFKLVLVHEYVPTMYGEIGVWNWKYGGAIKICIYTAAMQGKFFFSHEYLEALFWILPLQVRSPL